MVFNAAKDLVYTMNGGNISSGGYRISNILNKSKNGKSKKHLRQFLLPNIMKSYVSITD